MNPLLLKMWGYGFLALLVLGSVSWIGYQIYNAFDEREKFKLLSENQAKQINAANDLRIKERAQLDEANERETKILSEKKAIEDEAQANRDCIAAGTCGVRYKLKYQTCPRLPNTSTGERGADELQESERRNFESWINDLQESIRKDNLYISKLQNDVQIRSNEKYCSPK